MYDTFNTTNALEIIMNDIVGKIEIREDCAGCKILEADLAILRLQHMDLIRSTERIVKAKDELQKKLDDAENQLRRIAKMEQGRSWEEK